MRDGRPSTTATIVACARGAAGIDPLAKRLVPRAFVPLAQPRWSRLLPLIVDVMRVRTLAIDDVVRDAARRGITQVVVLGAGLCARAWRLPELGGSVVFEIDHPATQGYKRARLEGVQPKAREVRFVRVDFEKDDVTRELEKAGHDILGKTMWIWEGVTPYLTAPAIESTLAAIRARSADGSVVVLTYYAPTASGRLSDRLLTWSAHLFTALGEPLNGLMSVDTMHRLLEDNGFVVDTDATNGEIAQRDPLRKGSPLMGVFESVVQERILVATAARDRG